MLTLLFAAIAVCSTPVHQSARPSARDEPLASRVLSADLFKNGIAVVRRAVTLPGRGTFAIDSLPEPVHGTFWVESTTEIEARVTRREVVEPRPALAPDDLGLDLMGSEVVVHLRDPELPTVSGRVIGGAKSAEASWSRAYETRNPYYYGPRAAQPMPEDRYLELDTGSERVLLDSSMIAFLRVTAASATVTRNRPVLLLTATGEGAEPVEVTITYLTKGLAWAPSYRIDLSDPEVMRLAQTAAIRNELGDIEDAELRLISGFPSIEFSHVMSPIAPTTSWAEFFGELGRRLQPAHAMTSNVMAQSASRGSEAGVDPSSLVGGDGVDLHYRSIGTRSLREGDTLALTVARGESAYERIVEWIVRDTRDEYGRYVVDRRSDGSAREEDGAWDSIRFVNPLKAPMTTGPAVMVANGRFQGERLSKWVAPGEETTLRVNKALNIRTRSTEHEEPGQREELALGGRLYRRSIVKGELVLTNYREVAARVVMRRRFSGELLEADGEPEDVLRETGVWSANERHELTWTLDLTPGETRKIEYRYTVLVRN